MWEHVGAACLDQAEEETLHGQGAGGQGGPPRLRHQQVQRRQGKKKKKVLNCLHPRVAGEQWVCSVQGECPTQNCTEEDGDVCVHSFWVEL